MTYYLKEFLILFLILIFVFLDGVFVGSHQEPKECPAQEKCMASIGTYQLLSFTPTLSLHDKKIRIGTVEVDVRSDKTLTAKQRIQMFNEMFVMKYTDENGQERVINFDEKSYKR